MISINLTQEVNATLPLPVQDVFSCYSLAAKNIRNKTVFCISNIQSSYLYNKETNNYSLKDTLHDNEKNIIGKANMVIALLNKKILKKYEIKNKENKENKELKEPKILKEFTQVIDKNTFFQSINKTLIESLIRENEYDGEANFKDYTIINSVLAQNVVHKVCDDFNHFSKSLIAYFKNKESFKAMPQKPSYKGKNELSSFEVSSLRLNNNGSVLTINKNHKLFFDFKKEKQLTDRKTIDFYNDFDFKTLIQNDINSKKLYEKYSKDLKITLLRVVPILYSKNKFKLQYTISFPMELKGYYSELIQKYPDFLKEKDNVKYKLIKNYLQENQSIPRFASIDLGHVNMAAIYYFNGLDNIGLGQADIISSKNFTSRINKLDLKIDKQKQGFYNHTNAIDKLTVNVLKKIENNKLIRQNNDNLAFGDTPKPVEVISREDKKLLIAHSKRIYEDKLIGKLTYRKSNITKDYLHKLSSQIVSNLLKKKINLLIIGKNKDWKHESNIGSKNNRRSYNLPHSKLIELLKYKCLLNNILLIEQEESYTSKTSFACNEKLKEYGKENETQGNQSQSIFKPKTSSVREGQKLYSISKGNKFLLCHADVNGAMNIARKVIPAFNIETIKTSDKTSKIKQIYNYRIVALSNYSVKGSLFVELNP